MNLRLLTVLMSGSPEEARGSPSAVEEWERVVFSLESWGRHPHHSQHPREFYLAVLFFLVWIFFFFFFIVVQLQLPTFLFEYSCWIGWRKGGKVWT